MNIVIRRLWLSEKSTIGKLFLDGKEECFTLEPILRNDQVKPRAIPAGSYDLTIRYSPKHRRLIPHVEHVPGFSEIEIHIGNKPADTEGCCLVGKVRGPQPDWIGESTLAFNELFAKLVDFGEPIHISYVDPPQQREDSAVQAEEKRP